MHCLWQRNLTLVCVVSIRFSKSLMVPCNSHAAIVCFSYNIYWHIHEKFLNFGDTISWFRIHVHSRYIYVSLICHHSISMLNANTFYIDQNNKNSKSWICISCRIWFCLLLLSCSFAPIGFLSLSVSLCIILGWIYYSIFFLALCFETKVFFESMRICTICMFRSHLMHRNIVKLVESLFWNLYVSLYYSN